MDTEKKLVKDRMISNTFAFVFEKGEHKGETYNVFMTVACDNPVCTCGEVAFFVKDIEKGDNREYTFYLDVINRKIDKTSGIKRSHINTNFAKSFIKDMKDENWKYFYSFYYAYKSKLTTEIQHIDKLDIDFSLNQFNIEQNSTMMGYKEIFPFTEDFTFFYKDKKYMMYDQYCLSSHCNCKEAALAFVDYEDIKRESSPNEYAIFYNYLKKQWISDINSEGKTPEDKDIIDAMKKQIPDINSTLKERHKTLRRVYANFNQKQENEIQKKINTINKVGRNDPCPCGSGKKYKKCCGR